MSQSIADATSNRGRLLLVVVALMMVTLMAGAGIRSEASARGQDANFVCQGMGYDFGIKLEGAPAGTHTVTYKDNGDTHTAGTVTIVRNEAGTAIDWTSTFGVEAVIVKGGPAHNVYEYDSGMSGTDLSTPNNPNHPQNEPYGLSYVTFCFNAEGGQEEPQVLQHTVSIAKSVDGAAATSGSFDFTATWQADNLNGGVETSGNFTLSGPYTISTSPMDAGASYSVVETGIDGTCDEGDAYRLLGYSVGTSWEAAAAAAIGASASFTNLQANQYVVVHNEGCGDVSPTGDSSITIVKQGLTPGVDANFVHDVPGDSSSFTLDSENNSITFENLVAGTYNFTELPIEGWHLVGAGCAFAGARGSLDAAEGNTLAVVLGEDQDLVCTFVNGQAQEGQFVVNIAKHVDGAEATEGSFSFTATWQADNLNGGVETSADFTLDSVTGYVTATSPMDAGASYSVVENDIDATCDEGDAYRLLGYSIGESWEAAIAADPVASAAFTDLQANQYVVVQNEACEVAEAARLTIVKEGLTAGVEAVFTHDVPGDSDTFTLTAENNSFTIEDIAPGTYNFTELPIEGWELVSSGCGFTTFANGDPVSDTLAVTIEAGEDITCTFVNAMVARDVTVTKYVDGALATEGSFDVTGTVNDEDQPVVTLSSDNNFSFTWEDVPGGANFMLVENDIDAVCDEGDAYSLVGYSVGASLEEALAADPVAVVDIDLLADLYVIVWNEECDVVVPGTLTIVKEGLVDGVEAVFVHDVPGDSDTFTLTAANNSFTIETIAPGTYNFTELPIEGWELLSAGCGFTALSPEPVGDTLAVVVGEGEDITCTFVNGPVARDVTVTKYVDGALATEGSFDVTGTVNGEDQPVVTLSSENSFSFTWEDVPGGVNFMLVENDIDAVCDAGDTYRIAGYGIGASLDEALAADPVANVNIEMLMADTTIVVWNQECANLGSITIIKDFNPDADATAPFTAVGPGVSDFTIAGGPENAMTFSDLGVAQYTFTEGFIPGWSIQSIFCSGSPLNILVNLGAASVTVNLPAGQDITCTFTNREDETSVPGNITIIKAWEGAPGVDTTFTTSENLGVEGNSFVLVDAEGEDRRSFEGLAPATYTFVESPLEGWTLESIFCTGMDSLLDLEIDLGGGSLGVDLGPGRTIICTFTNSFDDVTPTTGSITVTKVAAPDNTVVETFGFTTTGEGFAAFDLVTGNAETTTTTVSDLAPGAYSFTETAVAGWTLSSINCTGFEGEDVTWDATTGTTNVNLLAGADIVCTYTNTADDVTPTTGSITITKAVAPDPTVVETFDFTATGTGVGNFSLTTGDEATSSATATNLAPGNYVITEIALAGWNLSSILCTGLGEGGTADVDIVTGVADIDLVAGANVVCTYTNTAEDVTPTTGSITVTKVAAPDNTVVETFGFTTTGEGFAAFDLVTGDAETTTTTVSDLAPGAYSFTETAVAGWTLSSINCTGFEGEDVTWDATTGTTNVNLLAGADIVCTYTNTADDVTPTTGSITINKVILPEGTTGSFDFTGSGEGLAPFTLTNGDLSETFAALAPGTYSIAETAQAGWTLSNIVCTGGSEGDAVVDIPNGVVNFDLDAGADIVCTYTNTADDVAPTTGSITITKVAAPDNTVVETFGFTTTGTGLNPFSLVTGDAATTTVTVSDLAPGAYSFTETALAGWTLTGIDCTGFEGTDVTWDAVTGTTNVNLAAGANVVCTYTNTADDVTPETGSITINKFATAGIAATFDYTVTGTGLSGFSFVNGGTMSTSFVALAPGSYSITETSLEGWTLTTLECTGANAGSATGDTTTGTATIELVAGANIVCNYTNESDTQEAVESFPPPVGQPIPQQPGVSQPVPQQPGVSQPIPQQPGISQPAPQQPVVNQPGTVPQSSVLGAQPTPFAPATGNGFAGTGSTASSLGLGIILAALVGGAAVFGRMAMRSR